MSQENGQNPHIGEYITYDMHRFANSKLLARNQVSREKKRPSFPLYTDGLIGIFVMLYCIPHNNEVVSLIYLKLLLRLFWEGSPLNSTYPWTLSSEKPPSLPFRPPGIHFNGLQHMHLTDWAKDTKWSASGVSLHAHMIGKMCLEKYIAYHDCISIVRMYILRNHQWTLNNISHLHMFATYLYLCVIIRVISCPTIAQ